MKKYLVINADDFGLSEGTNEAIKKAHKEGILTSASLFATTPGFANASKVIKECPGLGIGAHLSLTWGKSVLPSAEVSSLVDEKGYFYLSYAGVIVKSFLAKGFVDQVEKEFCAQVEKILEVGVAVDHINSHQHVHMLPRIFPVVLNIAKKYKIKFIRIPNEKFFLVPRFHGIISSFIDVNIIKFILLKFLSVGKIRNRHISFYGLLYATKMDRRVLGRLLPKIGGGITEILSHPAEFKLSESDRTFDFERQGAFEFMKNKGREIELQTLIDPSLRKIIERENIVLTNYRDLV